MPQLSHASGCEDEEHTRKPCSDQDVDVSDAVLPGDAQESAEAA